MAWLVLSFLEAIVARARTCDANSKYQKAAGSEKLLAWGRRRKQAILPAERNQDVRMSTIASAAADFDLTESEVMQGAVSKDSSLDTASALRLPRRLSEISVARIAGQRRPVNRWTLLQFGRNVEDFELQL